MGEHACRRYSSNSVDSFSKTLATSPVAHTTSPEANALERAAYRFSQFMQKETPIPLLEPQLVVVDDDV